MVGMSVSEDGKIYVQKNDANNPKITEIDMTKWVARRVITSPYTGLTDIVVNKGYGATLTGERMILTSNMPRVGLGALIKIALTSNGNSQPTVSNIALTATGSIGGNNSIVDMDNNAVSFQAGTLSNVTASANGLTITGQPATYSHQDNSTLNYSYGQWNGTDITGNTIKLAKVGTDISQSIDLATGMTSGILTINNGYISLQSAPGTGSWTSQAINVSNVKKSNSGNVSWTETTDTGCTVTAQISLDNGQTWITITNGSNISQFAGLNCTGSNIKIQFILASTQATTPVISNLSLNIDSSYVMQGTWTSTNDQINGIIVNSNLTWVAATLPANTSLSVYASVNGSAYVLCSSNSAIAGLIAGMNKPTVTIQIILTSDGSATPVVSNVTRSANIITYPISGYRISPGISLTSVGIIGATSINWTATTPVGTSVVVESSIDGTNWLKCINGDEIPSIADGLAYNGTTLQIRTTLNGLATTTPILSYLNVTINSSEERTLTKNFTTNADFSAGTMNGTTVYNNVITLSGTNTSGTWISPFISLANIGIIASNSLAVTSNMPSGATITTTVSTDGGLSWQTLNNGSISQLTAGTNCAVYTDNNNTIGSVYDWDVASYFVARTYNLSTKIQKSIMTSDGCKIFVASVTEPTIFIIHREIRGAISRVNLPTNDTIKDMQVDEHNGYVYVLMSTTNSLYVIDAINDVLVTSKTLTLIQPKMIRISHDYRTLFILEATSFVTADMDNNVVTRLPLTLNSGAPYAFITNYADTMAYIVSQRTVSSSSYYVDVFGITIATGTQTATASVQTSMVRTGFDICIDQNSANLYLTRGIGDLPSLSVFSLNANGVPSYLTDFDLKSMAGQTIGTFNLTRMAMNYNGTILFICNPFGGMFAYNIMTQMAKYYNEMGSIYDMQDMLVTSLNY